MNIQPPFERFESQEAIFKSACFQTQKNVAITKNSVSQNPQQNFDQSYYKKLLAKKDQKIQTLNKKVKDLSNDVYFYKTLVQNKEIQSTFFKSKIKQELQKNRLIEDQMAYICAKIRKLTQNLKSSRKNQSATSKQEKLRKSQFRALGKQLIEENRRILQTLTYETDKVVQVYKKAHCLKQKMKQNNIKNELQDINILQPDSENLKHKQKGYQSLKVNQNKQNSKNKSHCQ